MSSYRRTVPGALLIAAVASSLVLASAQSAAAASLVTPNSGPTTGGTTVSLAASTLGFTQVAAGQYTAYALDADGHVYAWGYGGVGQLGDGLTDDSAVPVRVAQGAVPVGVTFTQIAAGAATGYGLGSNGKLYAWGWNSRGQVGDNTTTDAYTPVPVRAGAIPVGVKIVQLAAGGVRRLCARRQRAHLRLGPRRRRRTRQRGHRRHSGSGRRVGRLRAVGRHLHEGCRPARSPPTRSAATATSTAGAPTTRVRSVRAGRAMSTRPPRSIPARFRAALRSPTSRAARRAATRSAATAESTTGDRTSTATSETPGRATAASRSRRLPATSRPVSRSPASRQQAPGDTASAATAASTRGARAQRASSATGSTTDVNSSPVQASLGSMPTGAAIASVSGGYHFALGLGSDGVLYVWGDNGYGDLGDGTSAQHSEPAVGPNVSVTRVTFGGAAGTHVSDPPGVTTVVTPAHAAGAVAIVVSGSVNAGATADLTTTRTLERRSFTRSCSPKRGVVFPWWLLWVACGLIAAGVILFVLRWRRPRSRSRH